MRGFVTLDCSGGVIVVVLDYLDVVLVPKSWFCGEPYSGIACVNRMLSMDLKSTDAEATLTLIDLDSPSTAILLRITRWYSWMS